VEWAERWHTPPIKDTLDIMINQYREDENSRVITINALGKTAEDLLKELSLDILGSVCEKEGNYEGSGNRLHN
jgi:hypothetical protein